MKLIITQSDNLSDNIHNKSDNKYTLEAVYIPNSFVGEMTKVVGKDLSAHDLWMRVKELLKEEA